MEASIYLSHEVLGPILQICVEALLTHADRTAHEMLGMGDSMKLKSSMALFNEVSNEECFKKVLGTFLTAQSAKRL